MPDNIPELITEQLFDVVSDQIIENNKIPNQEESSNKTSDKQKLSREIEKLKVLENNLSETEKNVQLQIDKHIEEYQEEIKKREAFNKLIEEALETETDETKRKELQSILDHSKTLLQELEQNQPQISEVHKEIKNELSTSKEEIKRGIEEGNAFRPDPGTGSIRVKEKTESDVDKYCRKMGDLRNKVHGFVKSIPSKLENIFSIFRKNKQEFNSLENRFNKYNLQKKEELSSKSKVSSTA